MDNFYKLTFTNSEGVTRVEHYIDKYPKEWFKIVIDSVCVPFICTGGDSIATCDLKDYVNRIVYNGTGDRFDLYSTILREIHTLKKLGDFVEFHINDGWFQAELVEPPKIDVEKTISENDLSLHDRQFVYAHGKCFVEEGKHYNGVWYSSCPFEMPCEVLTSLIKRLYPSVIDIYINDGESLEVEIVAESPKVIDDILRDVFGCDVGDGIPTYVSYGNGDTIERVKYTAVFTDF